MNSKILLLLLLPGLVCATAPIVSLTMEESDGTVTYDTSGIGNNWSINGTMGYNAGGVFNYGFKFNGLAIASGGSYLQAKSFNGWSNSDATTISYTVCVWVKPQRSTITANPYIWGVGQSGYTANGTVMYFSNTTGIINIISVNKSAGPGLDQTGFGTLSFNNWNHICTIINATNITTYLNGTLAAQKTQPPAMRIRSGFGTIGTYPTPSTDVGWYNGNMDDFRYYNTTLTPAEINLIFAEGLAQIQQPTTCRTSYDYCANITLPANIISGGFNANLILTFTGIYCNSTYCANSKICRDSVNQCYMTNNFTNVYLKLINATNELTGTKFYNPIVLYDYPGPGYSPANNGTNIWMKTARYCTLGNGNCSTSSYLEMCLNGSGTYTPIIQAWSVPIVPSLEFPISESDFTSYYRRNFTFLHEENGSLFGFTGTNTTMTVYCDSYNPFTLNLLSTIGASGSITFQTLQQPRVSVAVNSLSPRIREDSDHYLSSNYYLTKNTGTTSQYTYRLLDYTGIGQFYRSTVNTYTQLNSEWVKIDSQRFGTDNLAYPLLKNQTQYKITLTTPTSSRDIGMTYITDTNTLKDIYVSTPDLTTSGSKWKTLNMTIITDYASNTITCAYASTIPISIASYQVYNVTAGNPLTYTTNSTTQSGTLTYTTQNIANSYYIKCYVTNTDGTILGMQQLMSMRNGSAIYKGFDWHLESTFLGFQTATFYKLMAIGITLILVGLFSAVNAGFGALVLVLGMIIFQYVKWLEISWWYILAIATAAMIFFLVNNRRGVTV